MQKQPEAKIIGYNTDNIKICAAAARISTTKGNAFDLLEHVASIHENSGLIKRVLSSGHKSFIEHAVFNIAFCNVSAVAEQFLIEFRLASFTIKSRRYVDFSGMGYYIPPNMASENESLYKSHMDYLFDEYRFFLDNGVPKEDARFILPYAFYSNFYCTVNARELIHMINQMRFGRGSEIKEIENLAGQLAGQLNDLFPALSEELEDKGISEKSGQKPRFVYNPENNGFTRTAGGVRLISSNDTRKNLLISYMVENNIPLSHYDIISNDTKAVNLIIDDIIRSDRPRGLEQLQYTFLLSGISLSGITHIARHRMQSIIIPSLLNVNIMDFIEPPSIKNDNILYERYLKAFEKTKSILDKLRQNHAADSQLLYLSLSGNLLDIMTTMNARELLLYFQLRTCNRAQWEIRSISEKMLWLLRGVSPEVFNKMGPSCFVKGFCPEGKLSCGRLEETQEKYGFFK